jgi:hypothetical protein
LLLVSRTLPFGAHYAAKFRMTEILTVILKIVNLTSSFCQTECISVTECFESHARTEARAGQTSTGSEQIALQDEVATKVLSRPCTDLTPAAAAPAAAAAT